MWIFFQKKNIVRFFKQQKYFFLYWSLDLKKYVKKHNGI